MADRKPKTLVGKNLAKKKIAKIKAEKKSNVISAAEQKTRAATRARQEAKLAKRKAGMPKKRPSGISTKPVKTVKDGNQGVRKSVSSGAGSTICVSIALRSGRKVRSKANTEIRVPGSISSSLPPKGLRSHPLSKTATASTTKGKLVLEWLALFVMKPSVKYSRCNSRWRRRYSDWTLIDGR